MRALGILCLLAACGGTSASGIDAGTSDAATDDGGDAATPDYGKCGETVHDCMCACNGDSGCETACYTPACTTCIDDAATSCCPVEYPAYTQCITDATTATEAGPAPCASSDTSCVLAHCQAESSALQTCLGTPGCKTAYAACQGTVKCQ